MTDGRTDGKIMLLSHALTTWGSRVVSLVNLSFIPFQPPGWYMFCSFTVFIFHRNLKLTYWCSYTHTRMQPRE